MNTKKVSLNAESDEVRNECSVAAVVERLFESTLTFAEVVDLSEKCSLWDIEKKTKKSYTVPFTFVVPAKQFFTSVSRIVE